MSTCRASRTQPYEFVVNFTGSAPLLQPKRERIHRTKTGCLNCRKRKRKCDEKKPGCTWCTSKGVQCVWPDVKKPPKALKLIHYAPSNDTHVFDKSSPASTETALSTYSDTPGPTSSPDSNDVHIVPLDASTADEDIEIEATVSRRRSFVTSMIRPDSESLIMMVKGDNTSFNPFDFFGQVLHTNQILLPTQKDKFMSAAVNGFIVSVGPQCTHPLLTTSATFTPMIPRNDVLSSIAEACGSSYLSWSNPDLLEFSHQKYMGAFGSLLEVVQESGYKKENEVWLTCASQLLCLGAKLTWGCSRVLVNKSLRISYEVIRRKMKRMANEMEVRTGGNILRSTTPTPMEPSLSRDELANDLINNDSLKMDIENALIQHPESTENHKWSQFERMFIDSFVYNYSVTVLTTPPDEDLPNPFEVFRETRRYLKTPLFSCEVPWMNNPVTGASFDSYELAAKASYLIRHSSESWTYACACKMLDMTKYYPTPVLPQEVRHDTNYQSLKDSVVVADLVLTASKIILKKLINPALQASDPTLQKEIKLAVQKFNSIPAVSLIRGILSWALFVIGLACEDEEDRANIIKSCFLSAELVHGRHFYTIIEALEASWGRDHLSDSFKTGSTGLDVLFDIHFLRDVVL